jgi:hypothetical protein
MWRSRRWRKLLNLIDQLPRNSHYVEAQLDDEDLAEILATEPAGEPVRRISEWTPEVETLSVVADRLVDVVNVLRQVNGGQATELRPQPRPSTAIDRVRTRQRYLKHQALVARVLSHPE